ncbi:hypothetical protein LguiB_001936 [Lonicera macranthoides]
MHGNGFNHLYRFLQATNSTALDFSSIGLSSNSLKYGFIELHDIQFFEFIDNDQSLGFGSLTRGHYFIDKREGGESKWKKQKI